jgi:hypothetical protein
MGLDFRLVCRDLKHVAEDLVLKLYRETACKLAGFSGFPAQSTLYPRDFCSVFPAHKLLLLNPRAIKLQTCFNNDWHAAESPFGEGGRILYSGDVVLATERLMSDDRTPSRKTTNADLKVFRDAGIRVGKVPLFVSARFGFGGDGTITFNEHLDRVGCLIMDRSNSLHLILDPAIQSVEWMGNGRWQPRETVETVACFRRICEPMDIRVHVPKTMRVPYALNLLQVHDGRVLMTSGDPDVQQVVTDIMGQENVYTTEVPIRFFPTWAYAGIHCLVSDAPEAVMKRI